MLELLEVWKRRPSRKENDWLLAGVSVTLPRKRRIALLGAERAENSLVLDLLAGTEAPDYGAVRRSGLPCWTLDKMTFVDSAASFRQNAYFLGHVYGIDGNELAAVAGKIAGINPTRAGQLRAYPSVERRRAAMGLTLAVQFDWYFINEKMPSSSPEFADTMSDALADRISRATVVWATTNAAAVENYCNAGLVLDHGNLTFYDDVKEAVDAFDRLHSAKASKRR